MWRAVFSSATPAPPTDGINGLRYLIPFGVPTCRRDTIRSRAPRRSATSRVYSSLKPPRCSTSTTECLKAGPGIGFGKSCWHHRRRPVSMKRWVCSSLHSSGCSFNRRRTQPIPGQARRLPPRRIDRPQSYAAHQTRWCSAGVIARHQRTNKLWIDVYVAEPDQHLPSSWIEAF
jgi:hypothetical protein